jgi:hypothetical protein
MYQVQVSPDGGTHFYTLDTDTVASGSIEWTSDLGAKYAGFTVRIITDNITAAAAPYGRAYIVQK